MVLLFIGGALKLTALLSGFDCLASSDLQGKCTRVSDGHTILFDLSAPWFRCLLYI